MISLLCESNEQNKLKNKIDPETWSMEQTYKSQREVGGERFTKELKCRYA